MKLEAKTILIFFLVLILATGVFTGVRVKAADKAQESVFQGETDVDEETGEEVVVSLLKDMEPIAVNEGSVFYEEFQSKERVNVLCLGVNDGMTDTIMLVSYDMENQHIDIISVPRDTYYYRGAGFADFANHKINSIYSAAGVTKLAEAVSDLLYGMPIHYYMIVDYQVVKEVVASIGGVKFTVPFDMKYDDTTKGYELHIDIKAGEQIIDESNVMEFLRFRHTNPSYAAQGYKSYTDGDIQRSKVQQEFVIAAIKQSLASGKLMNAVKTVINSKNIKSDLTYGMAVKIATKAISGLSSEDITSYTLPGAPDYINELSFWVPDQGEISTMLQTIYSIGD